MPNHIQSIITLHSKALNEVAPLIFNREGKIDFEVLLPLPLYCWRGNVGREHEEAFPSTGLAEARRIWGTKWNAYGDPSAREVDGSTVVSLQTAWSHPRGWTVALFNALRCDITADWLDEGSEHGWRETYRMTGGFFDDPEWTKTKIEAQSDDHKRLHLLLWGFEQFEEDAQ